MSTNKCNRNGCNVIGAGFYCKGFGRVCKGCLQEMSIRLEVLTPQSIKLFLESDKNILAQRQQIFHSRLTDAFLMHKL